MSFKHLKANKMYIVKCKQKAWNVKVVFPNCIVKQNLELNVKYSDTKSPKRAKEKHRPKHIRYGEIA